MRGKSWMSLAMNAAALAVESQTAIALRMLKLSRGGAEANREAGLMMSEKLQAAQQAAVQTAFGASPVAVVRSYRKKVRANIRRLKKSS